MVDDNDDIDMDMNDDADLDAEFGDDLDFGDGDYDEFDKKERTLGDLWRENPLVKVGSIVGLIILILLFLLLFGGESETPEISSVSGSELSAPPATEETSQAYQEAVEEQNEARYEEAVREGTSALPTPIDPPIGRLTVEEEPEETEDPLQRWRRLQEEREVRRRTQNSVVESAPEDNVDTSAIVNAMSQSMSEQMQAILETQVINGGLSTLNVKSVSYLEQLKEAQDASLTLASGTNTNQGGLNNGANPNGTGAPIMLVPATHLAYAQTLNKANTDVQAPVLGEILTGPLAGNRILGSYTRQRNKLTLTFETMVLDGQSIGINAIALDPETTLPAMATDVDYKYFQRIILPAAGAFVQGAARAISQSGRSSIVVQGQNVLTAEEEFDRDQEIAAGVAEAGQEFQRLALEVAGDTEIRVKIDAGTPMALLFLQPVTLDPQATNANNTVGPGFMDISNQPIIDTLVP